MQLNTNKYFYSLLLVLLLSMQSLVFAQPLAQADSDNWEIRVDQQTLEKVQESIKKRQVLKGARIKSIRVGAGFLGLLITGVTLNNMYQLTHLNDLGLISRVGFGIVINALTARELLWDSFEARRDFNARTLRQILRRTKKNEKIILEKIKSDLKKVNLELVNYKNHVRSGPISFFNYGKSKISLTVKRFDSDKVLTIELVPEITYEKKSQKIIGNLKYNKQTKKIKDFKFKISIPTPIESANSIIEDLKKLNSCNILIL